MEDISSLNEAFQSFTIASKSLEQIYERLQEKVHYLTIELEDKNKQLQQALCDTQEAKDNLRGILESLREAIIVLDTSEHVTMFNRAAEKMLCMSTHDVVGKSFDSLNLVIEKDGTDTCLTAGGNRYNVVISRSNILDAQGATRGVVILLQDITRIRELESQQERNKRLIAMGEMAAQIVHEIRSPLCSIELYASMLENELGETPNSNLARGISMGIRSLNNILTNMIFFAKPQKPKFYEVNLSDVIDESLFMLMPLIESRGVSIDRHSEDGDVISGDGELLKQVFMNIIINAVQVTPDGGTVKVIEKANDTHAFVEIIDEGEGIKHENLERIFDPFFSTKEKGTGLGLAIASKILLVHDGTIKVKSEIGKGSCFQLCLPLCEQRD
ncbi:two-component system sensor histidine kinase NtrB [Candidatus Magnetobacterium casense]|uniref:histidine kinase n=1 Tax=Candidatus Magnetobacterium casense TaxID=1455061 RepID=A0ABS6RV29_9BACT|nr:ATP-binding protein [Candidatus Magnetobacterium casensis]MBV6340133.1 PAS domain S-box protein [Candidatus Magnetobacterium casensis]